ncbi:MAG: LytR/AlgR family response regulator transcription factor [Fluviicola sp.]
MINCVIVEDDLISQQVLLQKLKLYYPQCEVLKIFDDKDEAISYLQSRDEVHLVFLDVQINGGTALDILAACEEKSFESVFVTAHDHYAIDALNAAASYYLLKPLRNEDFKRGMDLVLSKIKKSVNSNTILVPYKGSYSPIKYYDIIYFESDGAYTNIVTKDERIVSSKNLGYYEKTIPKEQFMRSHHSYIVNVKHMQLLIKGRTGTLKMSTGAEIPVAQRRMQEFLQFFTEARLND